MARAQARAEAAAAEASAGEARAKAMGSRAESSIRIRTLKVTSTMARRSSYGADTRQQPMVTITHRIVVQPHPEVTTDRVRGALRPLSGAARRTRTSHLIVMASRKRMA